MQLTQTGSRVIVIVIILFPFLFLPVFLFGFGIIDPLSFWKGIALICGNIFYQLIGGMLTVFFLFNYVKYFRWGIWALASLGMLLQLGMIFFAIISKPNHWFMLLPLSLISLLVWYCFRMNNRFSSV